MEIKTIYPLVDTYDVDERIEEFFYDINDHWEDDDCELSDERIRELKQQLLEESTNGGLSHLVSMCFETWMGYEFSTMVTDTIDGWIGDRLKDIPNKD